MSNPLFGMFGNNNPINMLMQRFQQFQQSFRGNPDQQIQRMMGSGQINQQQYNQAVQMAQQFRRMLGGK